MLQAVPSEQDIIVVAGAAFIIIAIAIGIAGAMQGRKNRFSAQYYVAAGIFSIGLAMQRVFFIIHDYYVTDPVLVDWMNRMACFSFLLGNSFLCFIIEKKFIPQTRFLFTIIGLGFAIAQLVAPFELANNLHRYGAPFLIILPFIVYVNVAIKTTGDIRKQAVYFITGALLIAAGSFLFSILNDFGIISFLAVQVLRAIFNSAGLVIIWVKVFGVSFKEMAQQHKDEVA